MTLEALAMPLDIPWRRLAYSADMVDRDFNRPWLPPRWRSSLAAFTHVVPLAETEDRYPDARIVYLRLTITLTGWSPAGTIANEVPIDEVGDQWSDWQRTAWEAILTSGWAEKYWPCVGSIAQIAVYPRGIDNATLDDYPYFIDFEPKKRELYEAVTSTGEVLSGSAERLSVQKGQSSTSTTENSQSGGLGVSFTIPGTGVGIGANGQLAHTTSNSRQTFETRNSDTARERRELESHTTSLSQMYQLLSGYHLGTNRATFVMFPRPHIAQSIEQADVNLIHGERKLEGVQDLFLVVHLPRKATGMCLQVNLDTGHKIPFGPVAGAEDLPESRLLVVTRRLTRACAELGQDGRLHAVATPPYIGEGIVVGDLALDPSPRLAHRTASQVALGGRADRTGLADELNTIQAAVQERMLSATTSRRYRPRRFVASGAFQSLLTHSLRRMPIELADLQRAGHLGDKDVDSMRAIGLHQVAELFDDDATERRKGKHEDRIRGLRQRVLDALLAVIPKDPG